MKMTMLVDLGMVQKLKNNDNGGCYRSKMFVRRSTRVVGSSADQSVDTAKSCSNDPAYCYWIGQKTTGESSFIRPTASDFDFAPPNSTFDDGQSTTQLFKDSNGFLVSKYSTIEHSVYTEFEYVTYGDFGLGVGVTANASIQSTY